MKKKEFAVGEVFQFGLKKLKAKKFIGDKQRCELCALYCTDCEDLYGFTGSCIGESRSDKTNVIFVEVEEEE